MKSSLKGGVALTLFFFLFIGQLAVVENIMLMPAKTVAQPAVASVQTMTPKYPAQIVIPAIGVNARVQAMGLTSDGKMAVPDDYVNVGWYKLGAVPGNTGSAVMGAHVDNGGRISGVFKNLKSLKPGNLIYVHDQSGNKLTYKVTKKKIYTRSEKSTAEIFAAADKSRLNLITCYGTFLPKENTYDRRLVVFAELVAVS